MKITLVGRDGRRLVGKVRENGDRVVVDSGLCEKCKLTPLVVRGQGINRHDHDTYYADAVCVGCGEAAGELQTKISTVFGIEEDERVLFGRCRVY